MMRIWIGVALLACSWLPGLGYYQPAATVTWLVLVVSGTALLAGVPIPVPRNREAWIAAALSLVAAWLLPWPYAVAPLGIAGGLALHALALPWRWPIAAARGMIAAAAVLLSQAVLMSAYSGLTARSHELPRPLPSLAAVVASLLGAETAVDGGNLAIHTGRAVHRLGATWDLLVDPATLGFLVGAAALLAVMAYARPGVERPHQHWLRAIRVLVILVAAWLPVRAALVIGLVVHRVLRANPALALNVMDVLLSPWLHLALLAGPVLLAWRFVPEVFGESKDEDQPAAEPEAAGWHRSWLAPLALAAAGAALLTVLVEWEPIGSRKAGRVMVVERHSTWEPTTRPYNTALYGEDGSYTYAAIYDYCSRFYEMSRLMESDAIDDRSLGKCDVLVIKTPTSPYLPGEVAAVTRFVQRGGSLLLIGEHTDVFKSSTYLNQVAEPFGFQFRRDLLFRIGSPYVQSYEPPAAPHPAVQNLPPMLFAVSCSIAPGSSLGRAAVRNAGLWSLPPLYSTENYFPQAEYRTDMRFGSFIQLWAGRHGSGRVLAWTDSTIFSNFSTFEPGKAELMLGMLQWLNRESLFDSAWLRFSARVLLGLGGLAAVIAGLFLARARGPGWVAILAAVLAGWALGSTAVAAAQRWAMPLPVPVRPMIEVVVDRTVSEVPLSRGGFTRQDGRGYGLIEQWIPRLGYFTSRRSGEAAFTGDALVVICPTRSVSPEYRQGLMDFVASGGKLLVLDSPDSAGSTANSLLWPFGLEVDHSTVAAGQLHGTDSWPDIAVETACTIGGGEPILWAGETPVAARAAYGRGAVMAIGFGSLLNDAGMGRHWMESPDEPTKRRFELWYRLLRAIIEDRPLSQPAEEEF